MRICCAKIDRQLFVFLPVHSKNSQTSNCWAIFVHRILWCKKYVFFAGTFGRVYLGTLLSGAVDGVIDKRVFVKTVTGESTCGVTVAAVFIFQMHRSICHPLLPSCWDVFFCSDVKCRWADTHCGCPLAWPVCYLMRSHFSSSAVPDCPCSLPRHTDIKLAVTLEVWFFFSSIFQIKPDLIRSIWWSKKEVLQKACDIQTSIVCVPAASSLRTSLLYWSIRFWTKATWRSFCSAAEYPTLD